MKNLPHYTKVITLGSNYTENALVGEVVVQEKIDGSQLRWGIDEDRELLIGSKGVRIIPIEGDDELSTVQKMFKPAVKHILKVKTEILKFPKDTYFFAETLQKPKHNVLNYERVPKNHIVLFDVLSRGRWVTRGELIIIAKGLDIDIIPELYTGEIERKRIDLGNGGYKSSATDFLKRIIETAPSYLGNENVEGVVIKNYSQTIMLGGNVFPLFTKYVRETFKERHDIEWKIKSTKGALQEFIDSFKNEARWQKAIIHLKEKELLTNSPKDIGLLIKTVQNDIVEEEKENIEKFLYNKFIKDILRVSTRGLPEYYKEKLLENIK